MNYEDLIQQNISEARVEYESIINFIIPIKKEYNDLVIKRKEQEKALEVVSEEFSQMSLEYQELRTKLDDIIEQEIQEHKSIIRNYEDQERNLKEIIEKNESILKKIQEEEKYLENEKNSLYFREKVISDRGKDLFLSKSQINDKSLENTKKEQELIQKEQELLSKIQEVNNRQSGNLQEIRMRETGLSLREENLKQRESKIQFDLQRIDSQWKQIKSAKEYLNL